MQWFKDWFNTPYYHILYGGHNNEEALTFIKALDTRLQFIKGGTALDLACGKGRHSINLNKIGLNVTGVDLSSESIAYAKQFESETLHFEVHDMRKPFKQGFFDYVFNLFTSFGYFENADDNLATLQGVCENLKTGGLFIQDFFNADYVEKHMISEHRVMAGEICFNITKSIHNNKIIKHIRFKDNGCDMAFKEEVSLFHLSDFESMYNKAGLSIQKVFGDYQLNDFDIENSKRLIIISSKK